MNNILDPKIGTLTTIFPVQLASGEGVTIGFISFEDGSYIALDITGKELALDDEIAVTVELLEFNKTLSGAA